MITATLALIPLARQRGTRRTTPLSPGRNRSGGGETVDPSRNWTSTGAETSEPETAIRHTWSPSVASWSAGNSNA